MDIYFVKLKTLKQPDTVEVFIDNYLTTFEKIDCNEKTYYYNKKNDYTILNYSINNDGIGFLNTIYINYYVGKYCDN